ncbi:MAG: hypothetical protein C0606_17085 [Hyphomicrobiales bacterium]|nr:MAG: hypothetical protein C0606_17085 [Hyphomicrobiales bacterium]
MSEASPVPRRSIRLWALAVVVALFSVVVALIAVHRLELVAVDRIMTRALGAGGGGDIVIVAVTEDTLATLPYRSPIDRGFLADLIARIDRAGPVAIGVDVLVDQKSEAEKDARLRAAIDAAKAPVVMGFATTEDGLSERQGAALQTFLGERRKGLVALRRDEIDGIVRRLSTGRVVAGERVPSLAEAMAADAMLHSSPLDQRIVYRTDGAGAPFAFPVYPAHAANVLPDTWFAGKYVLIGTDLPETDRHGTPFVAPLGTKAGALAGVGIHAHMLAQVLAGERLSLLPRLGGVLTTLALAVLSCLLFVLTLRPWTRVAGLAVLVFGYVALGIWLLVAGGLVVPLLAPPAAAILSAAILSLVHWHRDWSAHRFIKSAFSRYVSPAVVERIIEHRLGLTLGGEKRVVTYVFTDLEGFTALSERLPANEVAAILNAYLDAICGLFTEADATIDKIVGDAVIGFFGAPAEQEDQATRAVDLALAIDRFSEAHRRELAARGVAIGATRIGIHKGEAIVGNFGGSRFFDYTGVGDTVNTAARLEGANRYLGTRILVSDAVVADDGTHVFQPAAELVLKGRVAAIACFTPVSSDGGDTEWLDVYRAGYAALAGQDAAANALFQQVLTKNPEDPLTLMHDGRLRRGEQGVTLVLADK